MELVPLSTPFVVTEPSVGPVHCTFPVVSCNLFAYFVLETLGAFQIKPHRAMRLKLQRIDAAQEQICHYQGDPGAFQHWQLAQSIVSRQQYARIMRNLPSNQR